MKKLIAIGLVAFVCGAHAAEWQYTNDADSMSGKTSTKAIAVSENSLALEFPYGGSNFGILMVRQHPRHGLDVMLAIQQGQFLCSSSACSVNVRFDERPMMKFSGSPSADHDSKVIFLGDAKRFVAEAKKSRRILMQSDIYRSGAPSLEFALSTPLVWPAPNSDVAATAPAPAPEPAEPCSAAMQTKMRAAKISAAQIAAVCGSK